MSSAVHAAKVLLIGWDAAEWKIIRPLLDAGQMPNLQSLIDRGTSGPLHSPSPLLSPMLWTSAVTGKRPMKHNVLGPLEAKPDRSGTQPTTRATRTAKAVWEILDDVSIPSLSINFPATHPANSKHGASVSNLFALTDEPQTLTDSIWPPDIRGELQTLRVRPADIDAASLLTFVPQAAKADRLASIAAILAHTATVHAVATWCLEKIPWRFAAVCYTGLHQFSHAFMAYHPPRRTEVDEKDFDLYSGVVTAAYRFHDLMLGRLLHLAGLDANVILISDHGFHCDHLRPAPGRSSSESLPAWHRRQGVLVMAGPLIKPRSISGASLLDVTPTVLSLLDIPIGADMDGVSLASSRPDRRVTWDDPPADKPAAVRADDSIAHLLEMGYVEQPDAHAAVAVDQVERANRLALAEAWLDASAPRRAIELLEPLVREHPEKLAYRVALARAYGEARRIADCRRLVEKMTAAAPDTALGHMALGLLDLAARRASTAIEHFKRAEALGTKSPELYLAIGQAYARMSQWADAKRVLAVALQLDADNFEAAEELASVLLGEGDPQAAEKFAVRAIEQRSDRPRPHYLLGLAMLRSKRPSQAIAELQKAIQLDPHFAVAHRRLSEAFAVMGDHESASRHEHLSLLAMVERRLARRG